MKKNDVRHMACTGESRGAYRSVVGKHGGKRLCEDLVINGKIILKWIFNNSAGGAWTRLRSIGFCKMQ
jgi:hypothetical protein